MLKNLLIALLVIFVIAAAVFLVAPAAAILGFLKTYQTAWSTILSAVFGFGGLIYVTKMGFEEGRQNISTQAEVDRNIRAEQRQEDLRAETRRRNTDAKTLATALAAELRTCAVNLRKSAGLVDKVTKKGLPITKELLAACTPPVITLYLAQLQSIGLLGELAAKTVSVYNEIQTCIRDYEIIYSVTEYGAPMDKSMLEDAMQWGHHADLAAALADRLTNYKPPAD